MAANFVSRFRGFGNPSASIYETIRQHDENSSGSDTEERLGHPIDDAHPLLEEFDGGGAEDAHLNVSRLPNGINSVNHARMGRPPRMEKHSKRDMVKKAHKLLDDQEADDDVPASLLIEGNDVGGAGHGSISLPPPPSLIPDRLPVPESTTVRGQGPWHRTRNRREPLPATVGRHSRGEAHVLTNALTLMGTLASADPKEKALWRWANVVHLDNFLFDVYHYYLHHGFWSIMLRRVYNLITMAFIVGFSLFLTQCIDYRKVRGSTEMSQILVPQCSRNMGFIPNALLWLTSFFWIWKVIVYALDVRRLVHMHDFYLHLLGISEDEIQSISWQEVVSRLMALRDSNPTVASGASAKSRRYMGTQSKQRMDAHDIANRLMRKENYMIAMVNKDILDMTLPIPFLRNRQLFTRTLEWNINQCIMDYVFNSKGQIRPLFLKDTHRKRLTEGLRRRFIFAGTTNLIIAPFLIVYFLIEHFFQYFNEYQKNPAQIGSRQYNPLAEWKFREFNELWHLFQRRINMSHPFATRYINQFPKDKTIQSARVVTLISGALVSVLGLATVLDQENFLSFEITPGRTTIFYIGLFGSIWAVARGLLPDDNMVYEPAYSIQEVIEFTHYQPAHWEGRLHSVEVKKEFAQLYQLKVVIFIEEILSMVFTPFVLWFSLPKCSDRIIDFFREFTVHVDGIGYVCSFAEFNFKKPGDFRPPNAADQQGGNMEPTTAGQVGSRDDYFASKDHKLEQSYWGFMNDYARNPKTDVRFPYAHTRRRFHLPPPVPGLPSPNLPAGLDHRNTFLGGGGHQASMSSPHRALGYHSGTPRFTAQVSGSPLQSLLLDPHHQPSASGFGGSPQALRPKTTGIMSPSLVKGARRFVDTPADVAEEDTGTTSGPDEAATATAPTAGGTAVAGELGSWKYENELDDVSDEEDVEAFAGVGPLGLIRQFQKAQGEGNRAGAGI